jgi:hypothetical protein
VQIKRTKHDRDFTVVPRAISQHADLSLTARGLLTLLLSQPEQTAETIKSLTADVAEGQMRVNKAMKELQAYGYIVVTNHQNERGHWSKSVTVYDVPQTEAPKDDSPKAGRVKARISGLEPLRGKNQGKNPPTSEDTSPAASADEAGGDASHDDETTGQAAGVLTRIGQSFPSLRLKPSDVMALAPVAAEWLRRGASELQIRGELTEGLPATVKSPRALLANRLERKMPPVPVKAVPLADCAECSTPLPRGQEAGICGRCAGVAPAARPAETAPVGRSAEAASLLDSIRSRRASGHVRGTVRRTVPAL